MRLTASFGIQGYDSTFASNNYNFKISDKHGEKSYKVIEKYRNIFNDDSEYSLDVFSETKSVGFFKQKVKLNVVPYGAPVYRIAKAISGVLEDFFKYGPKEVYGKSYSLEFNEDEIKKLIELGGLSLHERRAIRHYNVEKFVQYKNQYLELMQEHALTINRIELLQIALPEATENREQLEIMRLSSLENLINKRDALAAKIKKLDDVSSGLSYVSDTREDVIAKNIEIDKKSGHHLLNEIKKLFIEKIENTSDKQLQPSVGLQAS